MLQTRHITLKLAFGQRHQSRRSLLA